MLPENQNTNHGYQQIGGTAQMQKNNAAYLKVLDMLMVFLSKWYWFVICLILAAVACYSYLLITPPVYTRQASILIKNDSKGSSATDGMSFLNTSVDVNNELYTLQSPTIAEATVRTLHLEVSAMVQGRFHEESIYGSSLSVKILPLELGDNETADFKVSIMENGTFLMKDFVRNGNQIASKSLAGKIGSTVQTPIGKIEVKKSENFFNQNVDLHIKRNSVYNTINETMDKLTVTGAGEMSTIITLKYEDENPQRAEDVLSTIISVYNNNWVKDRNAMSVSTAEFISERLKIIEDELGSVDDNISSYKSANLIPAGASDVASIYVGQATSASAQATELNNQLYMARYVRNYLTNDANKFTLIPANQGLDNANVSGQIAEYNTLLLARNNLLNASSLQNPLVQDKDVQLEQLRIALIASIDNHIAALNTSIRSAHGVAGLANSKIASSPSQSKYLLSEERQQKVKESLYLYLLEKREENELSQAFTAYNYRTITAATGSNTPTFPNHTQVWLIGLLAGIIIPGVIIFVAETINNKVRGRRDLNELSIPFIGEIPYYRHKRTWKEKFVAPWKAFAGKVGAFFGKQPKEDKTLHILVKERSRNVVNEAFRVIRTNIEFMTAKEERGKVIMLSSFNPNSGKTFVATNLITSFAIKRKKVIAIDLDLRKASLSAMLETKTKTGISDYLSGMVKDLDDVIVKGATHDWLDVIPVGTIPPNPTELLFDDRLAEAIEQLKDKYDYIFLDCPPVEIVADATIVGRLADMTLFVVRADLLDRSLLPEIQKYYDDKRLPQMTTILNGTSDAFSYYGYHRYGSRYGYYGASSYGGYTKDDD